MSKIVTVQILPGLYITPTGLRVGSRGKVQPVLTVVDALPKGDRRKLRKALRAAGRSDLVLSSL